jgi:hypothetical protein
VKSLFFLASHKNVREMSESTKKSQQQEKTITEMTRIGKTRAEREEEYEEEDKEEEKSN